MVKTCIKCNAKCSQQASTSQKNFGRTYWACPNKCKKAFNGFVTADDNVQQSNEHPCKACNAECDILTCKSVTNKGRRYFACPNKCASVWNGWCDLPTVAGNIKQEAKMQAACPVPTSVRPFFEGVQVPSAAKLCPLCKSVCSVQVMRFFEKPTEVYFRCKACHLFCGFVSDLPVCIVPENVQVFENAAVSTRYKQKPPLKRMAQNLPTQQQQQQEDDETDGDQTDEFCIDTNED